MSAYVLTAESEETMEVIGVYFNEKEAKAGAMEYAKKDEEDVKYKRNAKTEDEVKKVLYVENTKEEEKRMICMTRVECELPVQKVKGKAKKDPNAPKKNMSAYMFFANDNRSKIKEKHPGATFGELGKYIGAEWKELTEKQKKPYVVKSEADKVRYQKAMTEYTASEA
jgi:hypothetical protein